MFWADLGAGLATATLLVLFTTGRLAVWHLYAAEAVAGACEAFQVPAFTAATTMLVPARHYGRASGLRSIATLGSDGVAPFAAGVALAWVGVAGIMLIDLATLLVALAALLAARVPSPPTGEPGLPSPSHFRAELAGGARYIVERPGLLGLLLIHSGMNLFAALTYYAVLPAMVLARSGRPGPGERAERQRPGRPGWRDRHEHLGRPTPEDPRRAGRGRRLVPDR
jgi:MFS family permease